MLASGQPPSPGGRKSTQVRVWWALGVLPLASLGGGESLGSPEFCGGAGPPMVAVQNPLDPLVLLEMRRAPQGPLINSLPLELAPLDSVAHN